MIIIFFKVVRDEYTKMYLLHAFTFSQLRKSLLRSSWFRIQGPLDLLSSFGKAWQMQASALPLSHLNTSLYSFSLTTGMGLHASSYATSVLGT